MSNKQLKLEYEETHVPKGEPLEITAPDAAHVIVLDVTQVGDEYRYRYVVVWDNGES